jgi:hypothetical protein
VVYDGGAFGIWEFREGAFFDYLWRDFKTTIPFGRAIYQTPIRAYFA